MNLGLKYKEKLIDNLCRLIQIPSRSFPSGGEEGELQSMVAERMKKLGARVRTFEADDIPEFRRHPLCCGPERNYRGRPVVVGELGPEDGQSLMLLAHSDTVPVNQPKEWSFDPFCGKVRQGMICGLGAGDDKWGIATMLTIMEALQDSGRKLSKKLTFVSTIDEEHGVGNGLLLLMLAGLKTDAALYLDGNLMRLFIGNLGGSNFYLRPKGAIEKQTLRQHARSLKDACRKISAERAFLFQRKFFQNNLVKKKTFTFYQKEDENGPFFSIAFYTLPGEGRTGVCKKLREMASAALGKDLSLYTVSYRQPWFESALISEDTPMVRHLSRSLKELTGRKPVVSTVTKQDAFIFNNHAGIPTVSFGPCKEGDRRGSFHQPDEVISISDAWNGCSVVWTALQHWLQES